MILHFPDNNTFKLALTSGVIPEDVAVAPVGFARDDAGAVWVDFPQKLSRATLANLKEWNVVSRRKRDASMLEFQPATCWLQVLPLERTPQTEAIGEKTPVLFELPDETLLPVLVNEMLRQGNDRQSFRRVSDDGDAHSLLRVVGPPYYTLLRALERTDDANSPRAFVEQQARVWVELGYRHPLGERITPAPGQHLLLEAPHGWRSLPEKPFRDVYEVLEFTLPRQPEVLQDLKSADRLHVPIRLVRGGTNEAAELWVLTNDAVDQLDRFVQTAGDETLARLAFAVTAEQDNPTVLVRVRPGRTAPPVLVFDGTAFRPYLRIPNLFVPIGQRLHPPLRRDAVKSMLAGDEKRLVWLEPDDAGGFAPKSVDDSAFLPLADWVDYVVDREHQAIETWMHAHRFEFDEFICPDDKPDRPREARQKAKSTGGKSPAPSSSTKPTDPQPASGVKKFMRRFRSKPGEQLAAKQPKEIQQLERHLHELERQFHDLDVPLDAPERLPMWYEMADVNGALGRYTDASICRLHVFWETPEVDAEQAERWFRTQVEAAKRGGSQPLVNKACDVTDYELEDLLTAEAVSPSQVNQLAAYIVGSSITAPEALQPRLGLLQRFIEQHESALSARAFWLTWLALTSLSQDVLALARARDRLLDRLYEHGLTPDRDLPTFLRIGAAQSGERFRVVREKIVELHGVVREWGKKNLGVATPMTLHYVDLLFAFAFARLGESSRATALMHAAMKKLSRLSDSVHGWLASAFAFRVRQALAGEKTTGPLSENLLGELELVDKLDRYKIDRLRQHSNVLEPHEKLDPYRNWRRQDGGLQYELAGLFDIVNPRQLTEQLKSLFERKLDINDRARLVTTALELSPRLGERFALKMLQHVQPASQKLDNPLLRAALLEKGLHIAAHYDQTDFVHVLLERLNNLLAAQKNAQVETLEALESLLVHSFRGLAKLGMREEIAQLLERMTKVVRGARQSAGLETERLRLLLQLAGGWFYFGEDQGWKDVDEARDVLFSNLLVEEGHHGVQKQTKLAVSYIAAVGQAPLNSAIARLNELFEHLGGIHDAGTYNSHYSLKQLDIVEALVQTIVSDGFTMDEASRRWLDDEEFLIRRRIHRDMREAMDAR